MLSAASLLLVFLYKTQLPDLLKTKTKNFFSFRKPVYVHEISGRFDVGNLPSYIECDLYFREKLQNADSYMI